MIECLPGKEEEMEQVLDLLYEHRERALDPECSWTIRNEEWVVIDGLLDWFNELRGVENVGNDEGEISNL